VQGVDRLLPLLPEVVVEQGQEGGGGLVVHLPQASHDVAAAAQVEGPLQAEDALAPGRLPQTRVARREHRQVQAAQVEPGDGLAGEQAAVVGRRKRLAAPDEEARGRQGAEEGG
jgi:hypothetical protein